MRRFLCFLLCLSLGVLPARGAERPKYAALTFDDGPSGRYTRRLLEGLAERDAQATFFLCGYRMEQMPELVERIAEEGHEIGLHGYSHRNMRGLSRRDIARELEDTRNLLPEGCRARWLRPPGGCCSDGVRQVAKVTGLAILSWSLDPKDWAVEDAGAVKAYILKHIRDGDVVLLHDMSNSSVEAALEVIDELKPRGWEFVTVSRLAQIRREGIAAGKTYTGFSPESEEIK